jgi:wyosine [tRNA(Phe)-imidazoG37] synthetase (radical SAM superfamily)
MSILFDDIVFGPVRSRRLGLSLGINLLPPDKKICTFNCLYCECGWTISPADDAGGFYSRSEIRKALEAGFHNLRRRDVTPDALTFAGNGEPTLHPEFASVIDDTLSLRDEFFPQSRVVVLSNSTTLHHPDVFAALLRTDNIMKLDAGTEEMFRMINKPLTNITLAEIVENLSRFNGNLTIQTLLLKGEWENEVFDNTSGAELQAWLGHIQRIKPRLVMLYPADRPAPGGAVGKTEPGVIAAVAEKVRELGIDVKTYG